MLTIRIINTCNSKRKYISAYTCSNMHDACHSKGFTGRKSKLVSIEKKIVDLRTAFGNNNQTHQASY